MSNQEIKDLKKARRKIKKVCASVRVLIEVLQKHVDKPISCLPPAENALDGSKFIEETFSKMYTHVNLRLATLRREHEAKK